MSLPVVLSVCDQMEAFGISAKLDLSTSTNLAMAFQGQGHSQGTLKEPWWSAYTASLMDSEFFNSANTSPSYYTPSPGSTTTLFHPQDGALHTLVGISLGSGTPFSTLTSRTISTGAKIVDMGGFQPLQSYQMHHPNSFVQGQPPEQQQTYVPSSFVHQDARHETTEQEGSPLRSDHPEVRMALVDSFVDSATPTMHLQPAQLSQHIATPPHTEDLRFHSTLKAPTAMIQNRDEAPVTYLNKGQAYEISVIDTHVMTPVAPGTKFRTYVRVSFEGREPRLKPGVYWSLWKEGREGIEARQRGDKLRAVEYIEGGQPAEGGDEKRTRVELETSSFDGFSLTWTPGSLGVPEVNVAVRFNFLSTDFSYSKGVEGMPIRLCAKTNIIIDPSHTPFNQNPEICFCRMKLFRKNGAERKLSNDVTHVKKSIEKIKHQISQVDNGMKDSGKRKHGAAKPQANQSRTEGARRRATAEDTMHNKLQALQEMSTSARPVSHLYLRGEEQDDPDTCPVVLDSDLSHAKSNRGTQRQLRDEEVSNADALGLHSPGSLSLTSQQPGGAPCGQYHNSKGPATDDVDESRRCAHLRKVDHDGELNGCIEALGVDRTYLPPLERTPKPVACFYILHRDRTYVSGNTGFHQAVYLFQRSLKDFNCRITKKFGLDHKNIKRTIRVLQSGLEVDLDDDVVQHLGEGQDMILDIEDHDRNVKPECEMLVVDATTQESANPTITSGLVLRLTF